MISAGDFRNGVTIEVDGNIFQIIEFQHVKPGKGAAFVRTKLKNIINGGVVEKTFRPTEKFENAHIDRKEMQYLYNDGDLYYFMDTEIRLETPLNSLRKMRSARYVPITAACSQWNRPSLWSWRSPIRNPALREIRRPELPSRLPLRPVRLYPFRCSSTRETRSRSIPERANTFPEYKIQAGSGAPLPGRQILMSAYKTIRFP